MTRFQSPALHATELPLPSGAIRGLLGAAAVVFTAALWLFVGAQAGQFGERDDAVHVTLDPVVIAGQRLLPGAAAGAIGTMAATDCARSTVVR